jgi:hypothetical protein
LPVPKWSWRGGFTEVPDPPPLLHKKVVERPGHQQATHSATKDKEHRKEATSN